MYKILTCIKILLGVLSLICKTLYYMCENVCKYFLQREKSVADEIVLITGTGHGIGKELAFQYALQGTTVVCLDVNQKTNEETVKTIRETFGGKAYAYKCDISDKEQVLELATKIKEEIGDVTILVNNAGILSCQRFLDYTTEQIRRNFDINMLSHIWTLQAFLPSMIKKNHGHIVALSSIAGLVGQANIVPYSAAKFAVRGLMDSLKDELQKTSNGKSLIKFTTIFPYMVDTGLCKKPRIRFRKLFPLCSPKYVAVCIISAQRRNITEMSIPWFWLPLITFVRTLPDNSNNNVRDFLDSGLEPDS